MPPDKLGQVLQEALLFYRTKKGALLSAVDLGLRAEEERPVDPSALDHEAPMKIRYIHRVARRRVNGAEFLQNRNGFKNRRFARPVWANENNSTR